MHRPQAAITTPILILALLSLTAAVPEDGCEPTTPTPQPQEGPGLRINEVMWNPAAGPEWIEIVNASSVTVSLGGLILTDNEGLDTNEGLYRFAAGATLAPGGILAVGAGPWQGVDLQWGSGGPTLANGGDEVYLAADPDGDGLFAEADVVDAMRYTALMGGAGDGSSLVRSCLTCDGQLPTSWEPSEQWGGTPGEDNGSAPFVTPPPPTPTPIPNLGDGKRILFDSGHCQRCGNADWVISGGYSDFGDALKALGFTVLSSGETISTSTLAGYDVLVIPEPQDPFTAGEHDAIAAFLAAGHGVMMIANHIGSDRNFSGWDAVEVFNGYQQGNQTTSNDWLANTVGIRFREKQYSEEPLTDVRPHPAVIGVSAAGIYSGTTVDILDAGRAQGLIYPQRADSWGPMVVAVEPAIGGRVLAVGDSSPFDDGTCNCGDDLTDNFSDWDHKALAESGALWLAGVR